jgi:hypothetical protein
VDNCKLKLASTSPIINGLSDHDAQILIIKNIYVTTNKVASKQKNRPINNETIMNFQTLLKNETWDYNTYCKILKKKSYEWSKEATLQIGLQLNLTIK